MAIEGRREGNACGGGIFGAFLRLRGEGEAGNVGKSDGRGGPGGRFPRTGDERWLKPY